MKNWLKILCALLLVAAVFYAGTQWSGHKLRAAVEKTRRELRQEGFKTELTDFNFTTPPEVSARANAIVSVGRSIQSLRHPRELEPMEIVGTNVALAISPVEIVETYSNPYDTAQTTNLWPLLEAELGEHTGELDRVCASLLAGPVKFQPNITPQRGILLPYLAGQKNLANTLAARAVLTMHEQNTNGVFTNLLGLSRMVTAWSPEPVDVSHLVRFACVGVAQRAIWESVQTDLWNDERLAAMQREWESARFFDGLPETAELSCADMIRTCRAARDDSFSANFGGWGPVFKEIRNSPRSGLQSLWWAIQGFRAHASYRNYGSYEDEQALLLYYRSRHEELQRAVTGSTWEEMRRLPGVTNIAVFQGAKPSHIGVMMNMRQLNLGFQAEGRTLLARAAEAEARRRLIVTAIALERFALQHKTYPQSLAEIVPAFLPAVPLDFMDGKTLRYRRLEDGRYLLYSVGLDGVENGGQMITPEHLSNHYRPRGGTTMLPHVNTDIVWPLRATQADVDLFDQQQKEYESKNQDEVIPGFQRSEAEARASQIRYGGPPRASGEDAPPPRLPPGDAKPDSSDKP